LSVLWVVALLCSSNPVWADSDDPRSFVLSNELGSTNEGGLIDQLIAAGHGDDNLYQVLQFLAAQPGTGIPAGFVESVGNNIPESEVFTVDLSNFAGLNGPVCINADGTLDISGIFGRDYDGDAGFVTNSVHYPGIALANFTMATAPVYFIFTGYSAGDPPVPYQAIGIAWANHSRSFVISNEGPGFLIDKLIAAGHGDDNLYQVLQFLAAQPGSGIPADFVAEMGNNLPGSEVFTAALSNYTGLNSPVCINADGSVNILPIFGKNYNGDVGYTTNIVLYPGIAQANFTLATSPDYYIDAGASPASEQRYLAIGIAWAGEADSAFIPALNEWGMILMGLILAGAGMVYVKRRRAKMTL
jgi:hypothetical protein